MFISSRKADVGTGTLDAVAGSAMPAGTAGCAEAAAVRAEMRLLMAEGVTIADRSAWVAPVRRALERGQRTLRRRLIADRSVAAHEQGNARLMLGLVEGLLTFAVHTGGAAGRATVPVAVSATGALGRGALAPGSELDLVFTVTSGGDAEADGRRLAAMVVVALGELGVRVRWRVHPAAATDALPGRFVAGAGALLRGSE